MHRSATRLLGAVALLPFLASPAVSGEGGDPLQHGVICVASSNIRYAGEEASGQSWEDRRALLASVLAGAAPDLVGLQEGWRWQLHELASQLPEFELIDRGRRWEARRMYPTILFRSERFDLLDAGDRWLSGSPTTPGSRFALSLYPRSMAWATLRDRATGVSLFVANAHLTHLLPWVRRAQARVLAAQIRELNPRGLPVILLGDFNEGPRGGTRQTVRHRLPELVDPWSDRDDPGVATFNDFGGWLAGGRIDWILVDRRLEVLSAEILSSVETRPGHGVVYPSDHYPIVATLRTPRNP